MARDRSPAARSSWPRHPAGGALALALACATIVACVAGSPAARAAVAPMPIYRLGGSALVFERPQQRDDSPAVATNDPALSRLLGAVGATVADDEGSHVVVVTGADRRAIRFPLGDAQFTVDGVTHVGAFAAYASGGSVYLPFVDLARALGIGLVAAADGGTVLQLPAASGDRPLPPAPDASVAATATSRPALPASEPVAAEIPDASAPGSVRADDAAPARLTGFKTERGAETTTVHVALSGASDYAPHRLADGRWYVDVEPATLAIPAQTVSLDGPQIQQLRIKGYVGPSDARRTVRVALSLPVDDVVAVVPEPGGLAITVSSNGSGEVPVSPSPGSDVAAPPEPPAGLPTPGSKTIVIDPGHGGSDSGATHLGLVEKTLTLDIAFRVRAILVARGWRVLLTRDRDADVFAPDAAARDELQARDDVANAASARLFVSIHCNAYVTSGPHGTTTYFYKPDSRAFAQSVHDRLAATLPTTDDGIERANYYVIHHASMPAILIESAYVSNPGDASLLRSPNFRERFALGIADGVADYASRPAQPLSLTGLAASPE